MGLLPMEADILPPSDDRVFKLLLTSPEAKPGLIQLISGLIHRSVIDVTLHNTELPPGDTQEKAERLDMNGTIDDGSQINLEMQANRMKEMPNRRNMNLKSRCIYYMTDLHSSQPAKGQRRYDQLARTYQVTFCTYTVFPESSEYVNSFSLRHDRTGELLSDAVQMIFVELSKLDAVLKKPVEEMTILDKWALFLRYAPDSEYREKVNEVIASEEVLDMAGELLMGISQNETERAIYRSRRKYETDYASDMATARDIGKAEGKEEGIGIGRAEGIGIGRAEGIGIGKTEGRMERDREIVRTMKDLGMPLDQICKVTRLTQEEVTRMM